MFDIGTEQQKLINFVSGYPKQSEVLIVGLSEQWPSDRIDYLKDTLTTFFSNWHAHDRKLDADFFFFCDRFLIVVIDANTLASGCARDSFFKTVKKLASDQELTLLNSNDVTVVKWGAEGGQPNQSKYNFITLQRYEVGSFVKKQSCDDLKKISLIGLHLASVKQIVQGKFVEPFYKSWLAKYSETITT